LVICLTSCFFDLTDDGVNANIFVDADGGWTLSGRSYWKTTWNRKSPLMAKVTIRNQTLGDFQVSKKYCSVEQDIVKQDSNRFTVFLFPPTPTLTAIEARCTYEIYFKETDQKVSLSFYIAFI
jgi:hypothetical protein